MNGQAFDVIVVGAGAAGCVLAGRLSEAADKRVLLIEAGPDAPPGQEHPSICDPFPISLAEPRFAWPGLRAEVGVDPGNGGPRASRSFLQGFGVGGGSNINGMNAYRGLPDDYDEWQQRGASGWGWKDVLPYFRKLERDLDFSGPLHGDDGPIPMRRVKPAEWAPFSKAVGNVLQQRGYPLIEDCSSDFRDGLSPMPISSLPQRRVSASMAYLTTAVRGRCNLTILADAFVEKLIVSNGRLTGVVVSTARGVQHLRAHQTIVSCGGLLSPALLMRSGIGPAKKLRALGIEVVRDLEGVGRNLQNHPKIEVAAYLRRASVQPDSQRAVGQAGLRYSSQLAGCAVHDMGIGIVNKAAWHPLGRRVGAIVVCLFKPYSSGTIELASADPRISPRVRFNVLSDDRDFERMVRGLRFALELLADREVEAVRHQAFLPSGNIVARLHRYGRWNWLQAAGIVGLLESSFLRRFLLKGSTMDARALARDEHALRGLVRQRTSLSHHVCGTCKMGKASDPYAVVDYHGRVYGIDGLRVADPSIFPGVPRGGMHIPALMAAEKMADIIKADWRSEA